MAEIVGIVASLVGPVLQLGIWVSGSITIQLNYLCCFNSNRQSLMDEAGKLQEKKLGLAMQVENHEKNARVILPEVTAWLADTDDVQAKMRQVEADAQNVRTAYLNVISRYWVSKKAKETADAMIKLRNDCNFPLISQLAPSAATAPIPLGQLCELQSRKQIEGDIMKALADKKVNIIGMSGMGGVGKTTMVKKLTHRVHQEDLFDETVMITVGLQLDTLKIQREIAQVLGLEELNDLESLQVRAHKLRVRLTDTKRILVILDDIWEKFNLMDLGIPCEADIIGCTTILASRNRKLLNQMNAQVFEIKILPEREAWSLFRDKAGPCVDDPNLVSIAEKVVNECKGLPIAITTVGSTLKDEEKGVWEDALRQLESSNPKDMPEVLEGVYKPLCLSYELLKDQHAKSLFLLCSLFPEDFDISLKDLTSYGWGLNMFEGVDNLDQARNRVLAVVATLKSRYLLLDSHMAHHVRMHDVIRDVAIFIASEEGLVDVQVRSRRYLDRQCKWISIFPKTSFEVPVYVIGSNFPSLRLLVIQHSEWRKHLEIKDLSFLEAMKELKVLTFGQISFQALPEAIKLLKNLRALHLVNCTLESISCVGELPSLEILNCYGSNGIMELPIEIGRLNHLKWLDLTECSSLKRIAPGIISNLVELEELKMLYSFEEWDSSKVDGKERRNANASLKELESLTRLKCLEIGLKDCSLVAEELHLSSNLVKHKILVGSSNLMRWTHENVMFLSKSPREINLGGWIHKLLGSTQSLSLEGHDSNNLDLSQLQSIVKSLDIRRCGMLEELVCTSAVRRAAVFPVLETLCLANLPHLKEICVGPIPEGSVSFKNLREINLLKLPALTHLWKSPAQNVSLGNLCEMHVKYCHKLLNLFSLERAMDIIVQVRELEINNCEMMAEVFPSDKQEQDGMRSHIAFLKLEKLTLERLPSLTTFGEGIESIEFPVLSELTIKSCPKLRIITSPGKGVECFHLFCDETKVKFGGLESLNIEGYHNINNIWCQQISPDFFKTLVWLEIGGCDGVLNLFSFLMAENLVSLTHLAIRRCKNMEKVIVCEKERRHRDAILFPRLLTLELEDLQMLSIFCEWRCALELPQLTWIYIMKCSRMELLTADGYLSTPNLRSIHIDRQSFGKEDIEDLNSFVRQHIMSARTE